MSSLEEGGGASLASCRRRRSRRVGASVVSAMALSFTVGALTTAVTSTMSASVHPGPRLPLHAVDVSAVAPMAMTGSASSNVVPQPNGQPSVFEQEGGTLWNYWYAGGILNAAEIVGGGVVSSPVVVNQGDGSPSVFFEGSGG